MSRRRKHPPCPSCLACGEETYEHQWCSNGPPPQHGMACSCEFCLIGRLDDIAFCARALAEHPRSGRMLDQLRQALKTHHEAPAMNAHHWRTNATKIQLSRQLAEKSA